MRTLLAITMCLLAGCASSSPRVADAGRPATSSPPAPSGEVAQRVEPWEFAGAEGRVITTPNFRLYTTERDATLLNRTPAFLETALDHYTRALTLLPRPSERMDTFLLDTRSQWQRMTLQILGARGQNVSRVARGGFAHAGKGVFFDVGVFDTLAIAAHEGWHQYTQSTFRERMPAWAEESIATYMEGHRWAGASPVFLPWANVERFDHLRRAHAEGRLMPLEAFVVSTPESLLTPVNDHLLTFYAQGWALVHFLHAHDGEASRKGLQAMLLDAQAGRLSATVTSRVTDRAFIERATRDRSLLGEAVFRAYFGDPADVDARFRAFVGRLVRPASRDRVVAGEPPLAIEGR